MTDACRIQNPQGAIALGAPFLGIERVIRRTPQHPIMLRSKRGAGKTMRNRGARELRRAVSDLLRMCLENHRSGADHFSPFAALVACRTHSLEPAMGRWQRIRLR